MGFSPWATEDTNMSIDKPELLSADRHGDGHLLRVVRDLILDHATGATLANVLEAAWTSGYAAKEEEEAALTRRKSPEGLIPIERAKSLIANCVESDTDYPGLSTANWVWHEQYAAWGAYGFDCMIKPGRTGIAFMEAGGEWSGRVIAANGTITTFDEGTFR